MRNAFIWRAMMLFAGFASLAPASLILESPVEQSGTGLGAVNTLLTLQSPGGATIETGCAAPSGAGSTTAGCGFTDSSVQAQFGTPTLADAGIDSAADLRVVFNASEPGSDLDIQLNQLVLTLYDAVGTAIDTHSLAAPVLFPTVANGMGHSGFLFRLDDAQATSAQTIINANGGLSAVRMGLGASVGVAAGGTGSATGGPETFFVENVTSIGGVAVPEPASIVLIGAGLAGLIAINKKRRTA